MRLSAL
jgi:hypothetical protein